MRPRRTSPMGRRGTVAVVHVLGARLPGLDTTGPVWYGLGMSNDRDDILIMIPARIPRAQYGAFLERLTGNDNDIVLAAEKAMRDRMPESDDWLDPEIELDMPGVAVAVRIDEEPGRAIVLDRLTSIDVCATVTA